MTSYHVRWKEWRTRHDSNVRPSVPQTELAGLQVQIAENKFNNINKLTDIHFCHTSTKMTSFCKLMAQNWHKNFDVNIMADRHLYGHLYRNDGHLYGHLIIFPRARRQLSIHDYYGNRI